MTRACSSVLLCIFDRATLHGMRRPLIATYSFKPANIEGESAATRIHPPYTHDPQRRQLHANQSDKKWSSTYLSLYPTYACLGSLLFVMVIFFLSRVYARSTQAQTKMRARTRLVLHVHYDISRWQYIPILNVFYGFGEATPVMVHFSITHPLSHCPHAPVLRVRNE